MMDTTYTKERCNECLSSLQGMLSRERRCYDAKSASNSADSEYTALRRSLIDVFDEVFEICRLQNRDTVAVAVSYLDRFMAAQRRFVNVQIAAMTCFYLAVKLYEPTRIPPAMICELFQRCMDCEEDDVEDDESTATEASAEAIESMEMSVLSALKWNLNPPTAMMFVRQVLCCLPSSNLKTWKGAAMDLARAHLEVASKSEETSNYRASTQAVAALFIATEQMPAAFRAPIFKFLLKAMNMTAPQDQKEVLKVQALLKKLVLEAIDEPTPVVVDEPEPCHKRTSYEETGYERPAKKQRSCPTSSPRSILFPVGYDISA